MFTGGDMTHTKDEALKLALEALFTYEEEWPDDGQGSLNFQVAYDRNKVFAAITAIQQALAAPVSMTSESAQGVEQDERVFARIAAMKKPPAAQPAPTVQEPVACAVCNEVHAILDADESKIIRDAKDGYPEGRTPRTLTLQERVTALCKYASDWKRWCLEKENTTPPAQPAPVPLKDDTRRLDALAKNSWDLRCFDMSDDDIGWRVIEHHMAKPHERTVAEVFRDDPRQAIDAAIEATAPEKGQP